jgi:aldose 1-epimerase
MDITRRDFGHDSDGTAVDLYVLEGKDGFGAHITTYGARVVSLFAPDREGRLADVVLGCDSLAPYQQRNVMGAVVGRFANRIAGASFVLNGVTYPLAANSGKNHIHGGVRGFDKAVWSANPEHTASNEPRLRLTYTSKDGEEGYPGKLDVTIVYTLTADTLVIEYDAVSDKDTIINLTNHSYFNLSGAASGDILGHIVTLDANAFTPSNAERIPTGEIRSVVGTPMDFSRPLPIGDRLNAGDDLVGQGRGCDHNWVLNHKPGEFARSGEVYDPQSGRLMEFYTSEPGVQFYTGNALTGNIIGKGGIPYQKYAGLCLEAQHYPDSPHHPNFPSVILRSGERYWQKTSYRFLNR